MTTADRRGERVLFVYWGRPGALSWMAAELAASLGILARDDVMALPYVEASQSGAALTAFGGGMPVVATPVGGLGEQVRDGIDGLLATAATPAAFADALARVATDPSLLARLTRGAATHPGPSVASFAA